MIFRRTKGIVTDSASSDANKEADVIMTASALGFAASYVKDGNPLRFDIDPKDQAKDLTGLQAVVAKIDKAVVDYLKKNGLEPTGKVNAGVAPDYSKGAVIMGVYKLANQSAPVSVADPVLSVKGQEALPVCGSHRGCSPPIVGSSEGTLSGCAVRKRAVGRGPTGSVFPSVFLLST